MSADTAVTYALAPTPIITSPGTLTTNVTDLNELCQKLGFNAYYKLEALQGYLSKFWCAVKIIGSDSGNDLEETFVERGPFENKRAAKESGAGLALEWLRRREAEGLVGRIFKRQKLAMGSEEMTEPGMKNWKGRLNEYFQQHRCASPAYTMFTTNSLIPKYSCELTLPRQLVDKFNRLITAGHCLSDMAPSTVPSTFGSRTDFVRSKKSAMDLVAQETMMWILRAESFNTAAIPYSLPTICNRPQLLVHASSSSLPSPSFKFPAHQSKNIRTVIIPSVIQGAPQLMNYLAPLLRLCTPKYSFSTSLTLQTPHVDVLVQIERMGNKASDAGSVEIGPVTGIPGKKKAKQEAAELVVRWMLEKECPRAGIRVMGLKGEWRNYECAVGSGSVDRKRHRE